MSIINFNKKDLVKSPLNYTGGKFKLLPQILPLFPDTIDTFVDLFGGGFNVGANVKADRVIYNDHIIYLANMFKEMCKYTPNETLDRIYTTIKHYSLSKENEEGFKQLRAYFNITKNPLDLYVLSAYSFNHQLRFNNSLEYNSSFGWYKSGFNSNMKTRLLNFLSVISKKNVEFLSNDFRFIKNLVLDEKDLVYVDCPYLITKASYNDGKRGFGDWSENDEVDLLDILDYLNKNNIKIALSNVLEHKGRSNDILKEWSNKYIVHYLNNDYKNSSYQGKNTDKPTVEVLITNY